MHLSNTQLVNLVAIKVPFSNVLKSPLVVEYHLMRCNLLFMVNLVAQTWILSLKHQFVADHGRY